MDAPRVTTASAGISLLSGIVVCALIGFALGSLVGLAAVGAVLGGFIGIGVGFTIVYRRFKDI